MNDLIIIGAGPMGLYAAFTSGLRGLNGVVLESSYTYGGQVKELYSEKKIYDVPGFSVLTGNELINKLYEQYKRYEENFPLYLNTAVTEVIKEDSHFVVNTTKGTFRSKKILIADGGGRFSPRPLEAEGVLDQNNIIYSVSDTKIFKDKELVILGGGDSAADWANDLKDIAKKIHLVHRRDRFRAHQGTIDEIKDKVNILTPYTPKSVTGHKEIESIVLENVKSKEEITINPDYVLVFYGVKNEKSNASTFGIETDKEGILVNSLMESNIKGIYAAGNSVSYPGKLNMIVTGMGEVSTAIGAITNEIFPDRKTNNLYSSILIKE